MNIILLLAVVLKLNVTYAQHSARTSAALTTWIDSQFTEAMDSLNIPGAAFVLMRGDTIVHMKGYGLADIENNIPVNESTTLFGLASISKTFVGVAIMKLHEEGKLTLDEDINHYLKSIKVDYKYDIPITIRQLLTHTAGLDERNLGNRARSKKEVVPLPEYLDRRLPPQIRPPGDVLTYSSHGYALLGLIVEDITGQPFHAYVKEHILEPLEMKFSGFKKQSAYEKSYSKSYLQKGDQLIPYEPSFMHQYPAGTMTSTAKEMSHYISMLLNHGSYKGQKLMDSLAVSEMLRPAFKHYEKAQNGWLLGFYERYWRGLQVVEHGGDIDGFANTLMLIPEKNIGLFISINASNLKDRKSRRFIENLIDDLFSKMLPTYAQKEMETRVPDYGFVKKPLESFQGVYRYTRYAQTTLDKVAVFIGLAPELHIDLMNDTLVVQGKNEKLVPVSDLTFYGTAEKKYFAFGENDRGDIAYFFDDTLSYHRLKWFESVKFQLLMIGSIVSIFLIFLIAIIVRRIFLKKKNIPLVEKINVAIALFSLLFLTSFGFILLNTDPYEFTYGIPASLKSVLVIPFMIILLAFTSLYLLIKAIRLRKVDFWKFNFPVSIAGLFFIAWLYYWNLIGFNY